MITLQPCGCDASTGKLCAGHEQQDVLLGRERVQRARRLSTPDEEDRALYDRDTRLALAARYDAARKLTTDNRAAVWVAIGALVGAFLLGALALSILGCPCGGPVDVFWFSR